MYIVRLITISKKNRKNLFWQLFGVLCMFFFSACKDDFAARQKKIESQGINIDVYACLSKDFDAGIGGGAHTGIILPLAGVTKDLSLQISPEGREACYVFADHSGIFGIVRERDLDSLFNGAAVEFSPSTEHLLYRNKSKDYDTTLIIHYLNKKIPFFSLHYEHKIYKNSTADWSKIPDVISVAKFVIRDTSGNNSLENFFWEAVPRLAEENELDYACLDFYEGKVQARTRVLVVCANWKKRTKKWKEAVRKKYNYAIETYIPKRSDPYALREATMDKLLPFFWIADTTHDREMIKSKQLFLLNNFFRHRTFCAWIDALKENSSMKTLLKKFRPRLLKQCDSLLAYGDGDDVATVLTMSSPLEDSLLYERAIDLLVKKWPDVPVSSYTGRDLIESYYEDLTGEQQKRLFLTAERIIAQRDSANYYDVFRFLGRHLCCVEIRELSKKHPLYINPSDYDCSILRDSSGAIYYSGHPCKNKPPFTVR